MAEKHNPRSLHRIRTRLAAVHGVEWELLQVVLGLAYTVQQQSTKSTRDKPSDSIAEGLHPALQRIAACAQTLTEASGAAIALGSVNAMVCVARSGQAAPPVGARFDATSGLSGECIRTGEYAICVNAAADPRVNYQACRALNIASMLYFPFRSAQGKIIGMLGVFAAKPLHFSQRDIAALRFTEGLVQEAIGRSANDPDPATLAVLLRQADFDSSDEPTDQKPNGGPVPISANATNVAPLPAVKVEPPPAKPQPRQAIPELPPPNSAAATAVLSATLPPVTPAKIIPKVAPVFVGRVVDESVADLDADVSPDDDQQPLQHRSHIPELLALLVMVLVAFAAWNYKHLFRSTEAAPKPVTATTAERVPETSTLPVPEAPAPSVSDSVPTDRALTSAVSLRSENANATITILLTKPIRYEGYQLTNPDRVYFDLHDIKLTDAKGSVFQNDEGLISRVRLSDYGHGVTRVVFDLRQPANFEARLAEKPQRLIIELRRTSATNKNTQDDPSVPTKFTIVIDPGHGGHDLGTVSSSGLQEKDLVLDVALRLKTLLKDRLGANVIMTRIDDSFISLDDRALIANSSHADFMISIHGNSSSLPSVRGVETYYFGSASEAMKEVSSTHEDNEDARAFAADVHKALLKGLAEPRDPMRDRGVRSASFVVLREAQMPAVLAEISYLTSQKDEPRLESADYREQIANALYRGIANHVARSRRHAPSVAEIGFQRLPGTP